MALDAQDMAAFRDAVVGSGRFPHPVSAIECIETHMSWVFLTGDFVYKVKKPIRFEFGDFSTLRRRQHFCEEELRINQRFTQGVYLAVVAVGGEVTAPVFERLPAFEYAVKMRQFATADRMDRQLASGKLSHSDVQLLAQQVSAYQPRLDRADLRDTYGSAAVIQQHAVANLTALRRFTPRDEDYGHLSSWSRQQSTELAQFFSQRKRAGFVCAGHGDLHLQNIARIDGVLQPFDALEFSPQLRYMDTLDEVALTTVDLVARGRADLAHVFLSAYLGACGDYAGMPAFRFYMVYRALVRAKVRALASAQNGESFCAADDIYLCAADALTRIERPRLIIAHGLSGSGKSTYFKALVGTLRAVHLQSDAERKRLHRRAPLARTHSEVGSGIYAECSSEATYAALAAHAKTLLQNGFSVLVDAAFLRKAQRERFASLASQVGVPMVIVDCVCPVPVLRTRITKRALQRSDCSEANLSVLNWQLESQESLSEDERANTVTVDLNGLRDAEDLAREILEK